LLNSGQIRLFHVGFHIEHARNGGRTRQGAVPLPGIRVGRAASRTVPGGQGKKIGWRDGVPAVQVLVAERFRRP
jgi:hypothetical protein